MDKKRRLPNIVNSNNRMQHIKGQLNRLSEANMPSIVGVVRDLSNKKSWRRVNDCIVDLMTSQLYVGDEVPARIVNEYAMMVVVVTSADGRRTAGHPGGEGRGQVCRAAGAGRGWEGGQQLPQLRMCRLPAEGRRQTAPL